mmetsp:Transcript_7142/g.12449  ORF Transcript_7142/g.12449 Transcript_7142/m.12449 type:complete len:516 (-) Transcript_7142:320-1867(-)
MPTMTDNVMDDQETLGHSSIDRETLLSEDVYFDYEQQYSTTLGANNKSALASHPVRVDQKNDEIPPPPPSPPSPQFPDASPDPDSFDVVSELSSDIYPVGIPRPPSRTLTIENLGEIKAQKDTPRTFPVEELHEFDSKPVKVTAWNSEGLNSNRNVNSEIFKRRNLCFAFVCLLIVVAVISLAIGINQLQGEKAATNDNNRNTVGPAAGVVNTPDALQPVQPPTTDPSNNNDSAPVLPIQSVSPTSQGNVSTSTTTPTAVASVNPSSSPSTISVTPSISSPTQLPALSPNKVPTESPSTRVPITGPINSPTPSPTAIAPTDRPLTDSPTIRPATSQPTLHPILTDTPTQRSTRNPTPKPTQPPTIAPTIEPTDPPTDKPTQRLTQSPTVNPTGQPTDTLAPTECSNQIQTDRPCYNMGSPVEVFFRNCDPRPDDWIGMYRNPDVIDPSSLEEPPVWVFACGSQSCSEEVYSDVVLFDLSFLPEGTFKAYLAREAESAPYPSLASSNTFVISSDCS